MADQTPAPDQTQQPQAAPQQGGFFSRLGAGLKQVMPYITPIANRLAAAAGNYGPLELEHQQKELELQQAHQKTQDALAQSQMQNQELNRQLLQKQIENVRTPEQTAAAQLEQAGKLEEQKNINAPPTDVVAPMEGGGMGHYNRTFNPVTKQWETKPTMIPSAPRTNPAYGPVPMTLPPTAAGTAPQAPQYNPMTGGTEQLPPTSVQPPPHQLPAMGKPLGGGMVVPDSNSPTGYSKEIYDGAGNVISRIPGALPPYAQQGYETSSTVEQAGPTGVHEINTTTSRRTPVGGGASAPGPNVAPPTRPTVPGVSSPRTPTAVNLPGTEVSRLRDQNVTLDQTNQIIDRLRTSKAQFANLLDAGLITLAVDPKSGVLSVVASRNLTPEQQKVAGDWQSLSEHINILRQPLGGTGFRSEEAWQALQAQRGRLTQAPGIIDQTLNNTQKILNGIRLSNRKLLGPLDINNNAPAASGGGISFTPIH